MMMKHSPKPWRWIEDSWWGGYAALVDKDDNTVLAPDHCNDGDDGAAWFGEFPNEADRLILQAAPNLLEVVKQVEHVGKLADDPTCPDVFLVAEVQILRDKAQAAIASVTPPDVSVT